MLGFLKEKLADLQGAAERFRDKETAEAVVAIMTGVAYADGELEDSEKAKMSQAFRTHPLMSQFDTGQLMAKFSELSGQFALDVAIGQDACLKELKDVGTRAPMEKRVVILRLGVAAAKADGEIEPAERDFLRRCAETLNVQLAEVGLA